MNWRNPGFLSGNSVLNLSVGRDIETTQVRAPPNFRLMAFRLSFFNLNLRGTSWQTESQRLIQKEVFINLLCAATLRIAHSQELPRWESSEAGADGKVHEAEAFLEMSPEVGGQSKKPPPSPARRPLSPWEGRGASHARGPQAARPACLQDSAGSAQPA